VAAFKGKDYPVSAQAVSEAAVVGWNKATMLHLMLPHAPLAVNMLRAAIDRLDDLLQTRFLELCAKQVERRVAHGLLRIKPSIAIFSLGRWIKRYSFCYFALAANRNH